MAWHFNNESFVVCGSFGKNCYKNPMLNIFHLSSLAESLMSSTPMEIVTLHLINYMV